MSVALIAVRTPGQDVVYVSAHIRADLPFIALERALLSQGLTLRVDPNLGYVIQPIDDGDGHRVVGS